MSELRTHHLRRRGRRRRPASAPPGRPAVSPCSPPSPRWLNKGVDTAGRPPQPGTCAAAVAGGATLGAVLARLGCRSPRPRPAPTTAAVVLVPTSASWPPRGCRSGQTPHPPSPGERALARCIPTRVYATGFGWQIGAGVVTYIKTSAVYSADRTGRPHCEAAGRPRASASCSDSSAAPPSSPAGGCDHPPPWPRSIAGSPSSAAPRGPPWSSPSSPSPSRLPGLLSHPPPPPLPRHHRGRRHPSRTTVSRRQRPRSRQRQHTTPSPRLHPPVVLEARVLLEEQAGWPSRSARSGAWPLRSGRRPPDRSAPRRCIRTPDR